MKQKAKTVAVTLFQQRVYDVCSTIPRGRVATYASMADLLGCKSPRAIGQALRRNPFAPQVPCHRVISSTLQIGGYSGATEGAEISKKLSLLKSEGVTFRDGHLVDLKKVWP